MNLGLSDQVRAVAIERFVRPAILAGQRHFSISVKELLDILRHTGFPLNNTPQVCTALQASKFLRENGLEIEGVDGPPSKLSTTVVVRYRVTESIENRASGMKHPNTTSSPSQVEDPEGRAHRLTAKLYGLLKEELAEYGGGEAFLRWVRSEDEDAA